MHELSVADSLLRAVLASLKGRSYRRVKEVRLEVGEFTLIGHEQLRGAFELLSEGTPVHGAKVAISVRDGAVECPGCGFRGAPEKLGETDFLHTPFILQCPACKGPVRIAGGDDVVVKDVVLEVD